SSPLEESFPARSKAGAAFSKWGTGKTGGKIPSEKKVPGRRIEPAPGPLADGLAGKRKSSTPRPTKRRKGP
ncbi:MAG: hypothetical protein JNM81_09135, partial [Rhodospirillaceae bacterium]|nr:hypothetical protein [Rhodospirillaceae bacterium]